MKKFSSFTIVFLTILVALHVNTGMALVSDSKVDFKRPYYPIIPVDPEPFDDPGTPSQTLCSAGYYSSDGYSPCTLCPIGSYSGAGAKKCVECGAGLTTSKTGATKKADCKACMYSDNTETFQKPEWKNGVVSGVCKVTKCKPGYAISSGGTCSICVRGYYMFNSKCVSCGHAAKAYTDSGFQNRAKLITSGPGATSVAECILPAGTYYDERGTFTNADCGGGKCINEIVKLLATMSTIDEENIILPDDCYIIEDELDLIQCIMDCESEFGIVIPEGVQNTISAQCL